MIILEVRYWGIQRRVEGICETVVKGKDPHYNRSSFSSLRLSETLQTLFKPSSTPSLHSPAAVSDSRAQYSIRRNSKSVHRLLPKMDSLKPHSICGAKCGNDRNVRYKFQFSIHGLSTLLPVVLSLFVDFEPDACEMWESFISKKREDRHFFEGTRVSSLSGNVRFRVPYSRMRVSFPQGIAWRVYFNGRRHGARNGRDDS